MAKGSSLEELEAEHKEKEDARNEQRQARQERLSQGDPRSDDEKMDALAQRLAPEPEKPKSKSRAKKKEETPEQTAE